MHQGLDKGLVQQCQGSALIHRYSVELAVIPGEEHKGEVPEAPSSRRKNLAAGRMNRVPEVWILISGAQASGWLQGRRCDGSTQGAQDSVDNGWRNADGCIQICLTFIDYNIGDLHTVCWRSPHHSCQSNIWLHESTDAPACVFLQLCPT